MALRVWLASVVSVWGIGPRLPMPEFEIKLDLAPEERFVEVVQQFKEPLQKFVKFFHGDNPLLKLAITELIKRRGPENAELQGEIRTVAKIVGVEEDFIHALQMFYELNTLFMVPLVNFTGPMHSMGLDEIVGALGASAGSLVASKHRSQHRSQHASFPPRFGCTGIIATDDDDGTVYHARNLDFKFADYLQPMTYTGIFTKNGSEVFRAQTIAGYSAILTGMRKGPNGFSLELNTRYSDHVGGNKEMLQNLFTHKREISGWSKRKILEEHDNYEDAVTALSSTPYSTSEYNIVGGVKKGVILARNADGLAYKLPLKESDKKYIIMTNFDYPWHDIKERFDPSTVKGMFHPRRAAATSILDRARVLSPELLFEVLNDDGVMAKDTIFQVIMNVETGLWNASLPACVDCGRDSDVLV